MNLLQCSPLCDSTGKVRYFIGAQIDVSGLAMEGAQMDSLQELKERKDHPETAEQSSEKNVFHELGELFSPRELQSVHAHGGNLFNPVVDDFNPSNNSRLYIPGGPEKESELRMEAYRSANPSGALAGVYKNVRSSPRSRSRTSLTGRLVSPRPTLPLAPHPLHLPFSPNPRHAPVLLHVSNRRFG